MPEKKLFLIGLISLLLFFGCVDNSEGNDNNPEGNENSDYSEESIKEILGKAKNITNLEYEVIQKIKDSVSGKEVNSTNTLVYVKNKKFRTELQHYGTDGKMITVFNGEKLYFYNLTTKIFMELPLEDKESINELLSEVSVDLIAMSEKALNDPELKEIGKEEINGIKTRIIKFNYLGNFGTEKITVWVSEKYGIPIKSESKTEEIEKKLIVEIKNLKFNSVQDSVFEIPEEKLPKIIKETELTETEEKLCVIGKQDVVSVQKCSLNEKILYAKNQDSSLMTDTGNTTYYDETGNDICSYSWFAQNDSCTTELKEWDSEFKEEDCKWQRLCYSGTN